MPIIESGEGEDVFMANLSVLIELMGGHCMELYVDDFINKKRNSSKNIFDVTVNCVKTPINPRLVPNKPMIYYSDGKATHFTSTVDGINLFNSNTAQFQKLNSHHFCQTFALMHIIHHFKPGTKIAKEYDKLEPGDKHFMNNAFIAKNVACDIIEKLDKYYDLSGDVVTVFVNENKRSGEHRINPEINQTKETFNVTNFVKYCRNITLEQMYNSKSLTKEICGDFKCRISDITPIKKDSNLSDNDNRSGLIQ